MFWININLETIGKYEWFKDIILMKVKQKGANSIQIEKGIPNIKVMVQIAHVYTNTYYFIAWFCCLHYYCMI